MFITAFKAENFKRLHAIDLQFDKATNTIAISGKNDAGKTSFLEGLRSLLAGKRVQPKLPVHQGALKAFLRLETNTNLVVEKTIKPDGKEVLKVFDKDGGKYTKSVQSLLNSLFDAIGFDPMQFSTMSDEEQYNLLKEVSGLDLEDLERRRASIYDSRRLNKRQAEDLEAQIAGYTWYEDVPEDELTTQDLLLGIDASSKADQALKHLDFQIETAEHHIRNLEQQLKEAQVQLGSFKGGRAKLIKDMEGLPSIDAIRSQLSEREEVNKKVRNNAQISSLREKHREVLVDVQNNEQQLKEIDEEKRKRIESARMPVAGLSLDNGVVLFNQVPFSEHGMATKIKISTAIGIALQPAAENGIRSMIIRDASLLDDDNWKILCDLAQAHNVQIFAELADRDDRATIVIEDGRVK